MLIRKALPEDIAQIIPLLKKSLGESLMPKSESFFHWKHLQNPFGPSKIIVAESEENIIGVRAFMFWKWMNSTTEKTAVRAVDTATDPAYQGKGIFTKLTMKAVDECAEEKIDFVFNTPNPISKIGYLKMGWYDNGRLPIYLALSWRIPRKFEASRTNDMLESFSMNKAIAKMDTQWTCKAKGNNFQTPLHYSYLSWRYNQCPVASYGACIEPGKFGFVFRLKPFRGFIEFRICELWTESDAAIPMANQTLRKIIQQIRPVMITGAPTDYFAGGQKKPGGLFGPYQKGPTVTLRTLQTQTLNEFNGFTHWQPSLGSMELF